MNLKENNRRKSFKKSEISQLLYKQLYLNSSFNIKRKISFKFSEKKHKNIYGSFIINRCLITNRSKGLIVAKKFKMARYSFRLLALQGLIPGVFKS
jgi:ribosomal protein S14